MSGGSYNYLFAKDDAPRLMESGEPDLERMVDRLAALGYAEDAARESMTVLAEMRACQVRLEVMVRRLAGIWRAIEWWDSNDSGEQGVKAALAEYRGQVS